MGTYRFRSVRVPSRIPASRQSWPRAFSPPRPTERGGFEPPVPLRVQRLSRAPDSATLAPLPVQHPHGLAFPTQMKGVSLVLSRATRRGEGFVIGEGGIRTPGTASGSTVFKTASFDHSDTSPKRMEGHDLRARQTPPVSTPLTHFTGSATILTPPGFVNKTGL